MHVSFMEMLMFPDSSSNSRSSSGGGGGRSRSVVGGGAKAIKRISKLRQHPRLNQIESNDQGATEGKGQRQ